MSVRMLADLHVLGTDYEYVAATNTHTRRMILDGDGVRAYVVLPGKLPGRAWKMVLELVKP